MDIEALRNYCLSQKAATEDTPFGPDTLVFRVMGKIFALMGLDAAECSVNLKCDPERAEELRAEWEEIHPGYHMSKVHWNMVAINSEVSDKLVEEWIDDSYDLVFKSLTKKIQTEILQLEN